MRPPPLTALLTYRRTAPAAVFAEAAAALSARVEGQGHPGVLSYRFFVDDGSPEARAIVDYRDTDAWLGHHALIGPWPELAALRAAAELTEVRFLGEVSAAMLAWLSGSGLRATVHHGARPVAGFARSGPIAPETPTPHLAGQEEPR
jgi:hypothetical protein